MQCEPCKDAGHELRTARLIHSSTITKPDIRAKKLAAMLERARNRHRACTDPKTCTCQHVVPELT